MGSPLIGLDAVCLGLDPRASALGANSNAEPRASIIQAEMSLSTAIPFTAIAI